MPGRKPKPTAIKEHHGNPGKRPLNKKEPKFAGTPKCPVWLSPIAKEEWDRIISLTAEMELVRAVDQSVLAAYCQAYARWRQAEQEIDREGATVRVYKTNKAGEIVMQEGVPVVEIKRHPAVLNSKDAVAQMTKCAASFGFDPSSRSRVQVPEGQGQEKPLGDDNSDDDYLNVPIQ